MRLFPAAAIVLALLPSAARGDGVDVTVPLVEKTLRFLQTSALDPPSEAAMLRAGVIRLCGEEMSGPGCRINGFNPPKKGVSGPDANRAWRHLLESTLAASSLSDPDFDKVVFQRYVMDAMVQSLRDPASFYVLPSVYRKISSIPSDFVGFGLRVAPEEGALRILAVHEGSPAWDAGLLHGEKITAVNGQGVEGVRRPIALAAIWGADGEEIDLEVERSHGARKKISIHYEPWKFNPFTVEQRGDIAIVRVRYFGQGLADAVRRQLTGGGMGIVLDLRDAGGGDEGEMLAVADLFLGEGSVGAKQMRGDLGNRCWAARRGDEGESLDTPLALVVNRGTSGLAEVIAMALRRHNRALLVGQPTAGMDTLETIRPFKDGSAIQVTSTRLFGPSSASLAGGVLPHLKTKRSAVADLAVKVLELAKGHDMESLIKAAHRAVDLP